MSQPRDLSPVAIPPSVLSQPTLRRLFLTLFLRGRSARGLRKESTPKTVGTKLALTLAFYALFGMVACMFIGQPVFSLALYLHAMTLMFLGMFVGTTAGEVLFNQEEADILLHRPVTPGVLLRAKICVLLQVSLWLAGAFNLAGFVVGTVGSGGSWLFPMVHACSTVLEALFTTGSVVLVYQLCLRWFGRERLNALMTTAQVVMAVSFVVASQLVPQLLRHLNGKLHVNDEAWWLWLLPPAWFAGFDDALAGTASVRSWSLAGLGLAAMAVVLWLAFGKLVRHYETGLQTLSESTARSPQPRAERSWVHTLVSLPPLCWLLSAPVARASFILTMAYLIRDRDVKLRVYPGVAPMLVMPLIFLFQDHRHGSGSFGVAFAGSYLGLVPLLGLNMLQYSQHWQAADIFRAAPIPGPAPLSNGARQAVLWVLTAPILTIYGLLLWLAGTEPAQLAMLLPGLISLPVYSLIPCLGGKGVPLSLPNEEAKSAGRGLQMIGVLFASMLLSGLTAWAWTSGFFLVLLLVELVAVTALHMTLSASLAAARWPSLE